MSKSDNWYVGTKVQHNFSNQKGIILEHRADKPYNWLVRFELENGEFHEDWFKEDVLEELK